MKKKILLLLLSILLIITCTSCNKKKITSTPTDSDTTIQIPDTTTPNDENNNTNGETKTETPPETQEPFPFEDNTDGLYKFKEYDHSLIKGLNRIGMDMTTYSICSSKTSDAGLKQMTKENIYDFLEEYCDVVVYTELNIFTSQSTFKDSRTILIISSPQFSPYKSIYPTIYTDVGNNNCYIVYNVDSYGRTYEDMFDDSSYIEPGETTNKERIHNSSKATYQVISFRENIERFENIYIMISDAVHPN